MNKRIPVVLILVFAMTPLYTSADIGARHNRFLSVVAGGNTVNQIWEYLSVFAITNLYPEKHFMAYVPDGIIDHVEIMFQPVTLNRLSTFRNQCNNSANYELKIGEDFNANKLAPEGEGILLEKYSARYGDILRYGMKNVRKELRFKDEKVTEAMNKLNHIRKKVRIPETVEAAFIGVHYESDDCLNLLAKNRSSSKKGPSDYTYYKRAMHYFKLRFLFPIFILISSDRKWVKENAPKLAGNKAVLPYKASGDKSKDFYLLSHCNHTILNYGTFSSLAALWNGGITIVYDLEVELDFRAPTVAMGIATLLDNWIILP